MVRRLYFVLFFVLMLTLSLAVSGQELDFVLEHGTNVSTTAGAEETEVFNDSTLSASFRWDLSPWIRLNAGGFVSAGTPYDQVRGDLDLLSLRIEVPVTAGSIDESAQVPPSGFVRSPVFRASVGRQTASEFSGFIMNTTVDGVSASYTNATIDAGMLLGYSGLTMRAGSSLNGSDAEAADSDNVFAPSRGIAQLKVAFPELLSRQSVLFTAIGQYDLPELESSGLSGEESLYHSLHVGAGLTGPLSRLLFYTLFGYYQRPWLVDGENVTTADEAALGGSIRLYVEELAYSTLQARAAIATGAEGDGDLTGFRAVTDPVLNNQLEPALTDVWLGELSYSARPLAPPYPRNTGVRVKGIYQALGSGEDFLGSAAILDVRYQPTWDLNFILRGNAFWPTEDGSAPLLQLDANVRLAF